ncbi:exosortase-associated protein EpsI, B-type [Sideroxydans sp. CL21]|uniref:exosortase-associated protein EpsI, B-type n=1 Tax=Sideroxydans sp. CL21 TaxID=2600596 RepID=UPI0024BC07B4|nr:exosortase-associated protein EpsI, B-type [Sideroxydans sp. CL21]
MKKPVTVSLVMGIFMLLASVLAMLATPTVIDSDKTEKLNLEAIIPKEFNGWKMDLAYVEPMVSPDVKGQIDNIYNQTLSRTYINSQGERVMLAIAYGRDQRVDLQVHRPEICYAAGGFDIKKMTKIFLDTTVGKIPAMRLVAKQGNRNEPITYWIKIGNSLTRGWFEEKWATFRYELTGQIPDGLLFRVSTISNDEQASYQIQQTFLTDLLRSMRSGDRQWLVGQAGL